MPPFGESAGEVPFTQVSVQRVGANPSTNSGQILVYTRRKMSTLVGGTKVDICGGTKVDKRPKNFVGFRSVL